MVQIHDTHECQEKVECVYIPQKTPAMKLTAGVVILCPAGNLYSSPRLYFATIFWILSLGFSRSLIEESWFSVSMI